MKRIKINLSLVAVIVALWFSAFTAGPRGSTSNPKFIDIWYQFIAPGGVSNATTRANFLNYIEFPGSPSDATIMNLACHGQIKLCAIKLPDVIGSPNPNPAAFTTAYKAKIEAAVTTLQDDLLNKIELGH